MHTLCQNPASFNTNRFDPRVHRLLILADSIGQMRLRSLQMYPEGSVADPACTCPAGKGWDTVINMPNRRYRILVPGIVLALTLLAADSNKRAVSRPWTADEFPPYIRRLTYFGERADWSHDGKRILFVEKTYGDVYEVEVATGRIYPMTHHYYHSGYTRALYLSNGDILLSGARKFDPENPHVSRHQTAELWVLSRKLDRPPVPLGTYCSEGPAVSRTRLRIAWTITHQNYPDQLPPGTSQIWMGDIDYSTGEPRLVNKRLVLDSRNLPFQCTLETQNFVPPDETKLTFSAYGYQGTEVMMLDLKTGEVRNMSQAPGQYDEPEGIFPDGKYTLVECDKHTGPNYKGSQHIDIYRLALDGSGRYERITYFNEAGVYKASNPVVSDDGRYIAFQVPRVGMLAGVGTGIYVLDLKAAGLK